MPNTVRRGVSQPSHRYDGVCARRSQVRVATSAAIALLITTGVWAQTPTVTQAAVALPAELAAPIAAALSPDVVTVTVGSVKLDFWLVKTLPLRAAPASGAVTWSDVPEGALVGAVRLTGPWTDIRGYSIRPGAYTLRYALQPQNGDHMGISPFREFLLPGLAADDTSVDAVGYDGAVALAKQVSRRAHPAAISLDPPDASGNALSTTTNDLGHQVIILSVPVAAEGQPSGRLTFGVVVQGTIEH